MAYHPSARQIEEERIWLIEQRARERKQEIKRLRARFTELVNKTFDVSRDPDLDDATRKIRNARLDKEMFKVVGQIQKLEGKTS